MGLSSKCFFSRKTVTGLSGDVYASAVGPTAVTVFVQKIWDSIANKA